MTTGYSFYGMEQVGGNGGNGGDGGGQTRKNPASTRQIEVYLDRCRRLKIAPRNLEGLTYDEMDVLIKEVRAINPVSDKQKEIIRDLSVQLGRPAPSDTEFAKLQGGQDGSASRLIQKLKRDLIEFSGSLPPTEEQVRAVVQMFTFPGADFEGDLGIPTRIKQEDGMTRVLLAMEVAQLVKDTVSRELASNFIQKNKVGFEEWKRTRITMSQINSIRELERQISRLYSGVITEITVNQHGEIVEEEVVRKNGDKSKQWNPRAYEPLDNVQLMMMSQEEAQRWIAQLEYDARRGRIEAQDPYYEQEHDVTFESIRQAKSKTEYDTIQYTRLNNILHGINAVRGENNEDLIHSAFNIYGGMGQDMTNQDNIRAKKRTIRDAMLSTVSDGFMTYGELTRMCENCDIAMEILLGIETKHSFTHHEAPTERMRSREKDIMRYVW